MKLSTKLAGIAAAALTAPLLAGVALAGTPSADGTITACVTAEGAPRIIDTEAGETCAGEERQVSWSAGWRHRGTYDGTQTYDVGDVVILPKLCSSSSIQYFSQPTTYVKVAPGSEDQGVYPRCPFASPTWRPLTRPLRWDQLPGPVSLRVKVADENTGYYAGGKYTVSTWNYPGIVWLQVTHTNAANCTVSATAVSDQPATVTRVTAQYAQWIGLQVRYTNGSYADVPLDVILDCPLRTT